MAKYPTGYEPPSITMTQREIDDWCDNREEWERDKRRCKWVLYAMLALSAVSFVCVLHLTF